VGASCERIKFGASSITSAGAVLVTGRVKWEPYDEATDTWTPEAEAADSWTPYIESTNTWSAAA